MLRLTLIDLFKPVLQTIKGFSIINSINKHNPCCTFVICFRNSFEPLLSSSIPNLHFYFDPLHWDGLDFKVNSNGSDMRHLIFLVYVSKQYIGFSHRTVSNNYYFHEVVKFLLVSFPAHAPKCSVVIFL